MSNNIPELERYAKNGRILIWLLAFIDSGSRRCRYSYWFDIRGAHLETFSIKQIMKMVQFHIMLDFFEILSWVLQRRFLAFEDFEKV